MQPPTSNEPYFESLRDLLDHLERIGKLHRITKSVDKDWEIACITRQVMYQPPERRYAMLFSKSCVIFNDYLAPQSPIKWLQLAGRNRALMESYVHSTEDLAMAMSAWRKRASEKPT